MVQRPLLSFLLLLAGDCAVLLQAGMPFRRVLLFNLLSAFLAYWGIVVGTILSQSTSQVTPWIFAITAGVFLYVALVDMVRAASSFLTSPAAQHCRSQSLSCGSPEESSQKNLPPYTMYTTL